MAALGSYLGLYSVEVAMWAIGRCGTPGWVYGL